MKRGINVSSEIGFLNKVLVCQPGKEFNNLLPLMLESNSFNDLPDLKILEKDHDYVTNLLRKHGVSVVYLIDLMVESLNANANIRDKFIKQFIKEAGVKLNFVYNEIYNLLSSISDTKKLVYKCLEGIRYSELKIPNSPFFDIDIHKDLAVPPLTRMCFLRDIFMFIEDGIIISTNSNCSREAIFIEYILKYHPRYKNTKVYNSRYSNLLINTKDILLLNDEVVCIGLSKDTNSLSASALAGKILNEKRYKQVIVFDFNDNLKGKHLDSLISMIDRDKFVIANDFPQNITIYELSLHNEKLVINNLNMSLDKVLEKYLHLKPVMFLKCGNGNYFDYQKEEHHYALGMVPIKEKVVLAYDINHATNELLRENDITVIEINSSEFLKGMSGLKSILVPLIREK